MASELISVIVPVFNHARFIGQALDSVIAQRGVRTEIIVVDDASDDDIDLRIKPYLDRIVYLRQPKRGTSAAKNAGIKRSSGEMISFVDADDYWLPGKLELQLDVLRKNPEIQIVYGYCREFYDEELSEAERSTIRCSPEPLLSELPSIMLARKSVFDRVGYYDESFILGMDIDWALRCRASGAKTYVLPQTLYCRRIHRNNSGRVNKSFKRDRVNALKAHLDRTRIKATGHDS